MPDRNYPSAPRRPSPAPSSDPAPAARSGGSRFSDIAAGRTPGKTAPPPPQTRRAAEPAREPAREAEPVRQPEPEREPERQPEPEPVRQPEPERERAPRSGSSRFVSRSERKAEAPSDGFDDDIGGSDADVIVPTLSNYDPDDNYSFGAMMDEPRPAHSERRFEPRRERDDRRPAPPQRRRRRKRKPSKGMGVAIFLVFAALVSCVLVATKYTVIDGALIPLGTRGLDLRGHTLSNVIGISRCKDLEAADLRGCGITTKQYDRLKSRVPDCEIIWDVPLSGGVYLPCDTSSSDLTGTVGMDYDGLKAGLAHLPNLERIVLSDCGFSDDQLRQMEDELNGPNLLWTVEIGGNRIMNDATSLSVSGSDAISLDEVTEKLQYFSDIAALDLTGCASDDELLEYAKQTKNATVTWKVQLSDGSVPSDAAELRITDAADLAKVRYFYRLSSLYATGLGLTDLSFLEDLSSELTALDVSGNQIKDLSPLAEQKSLLYINADGNKISDISPLTSLDSLETLFLSRNSISKLPKGMSDMESLSRLVLAGNAITDPSPLSGMPALRTLDLQKNSIAEISGMKNLDALEELVLDSNNMNLPMSDVKALKKFKSLRQLSLMDNNMWRPYVHELFKAIPDCTVSTDTLYWVDPNDQEG